MWDLISWKCGVYLYNKSSIVICTNRKQTSTSTPEPSYFTVNRFTLHRIRSYLRKSYGIRLCNKRDSTRSRSNRYGLLNYSGTTASYVWVLACVISVLRHTYVRPSSRDRHLTAVLWLSNLQWKLLYGCLFPKIAFFTTYLMYRGTIYLNKIYVSFSHKTVRYTTCSTDDNRNLSSTCVFCLYVNTSMILYK